MIGQEAEGEVVEFPARLPGQPFPPPRYADLRERGCPVRSRLPNGQPIWLASRYEDVRAVLTDPRISANPANPGFPQFAATGGVPTQEQIPGWFVGLDPPEHDRYRKVLIPEFSVRRIRKWRPAIQRAVDECVDALLECDGHADLVSAFAVTVPSRIIATILGVPQSDRAFYESRTQILVSLSETTDEQRTDAAQQLLRHINRLIAIKQKWPGDDLISRILATGVLKPQELSGVVMLLLIAGHETTASNIALGVLTLLRNPEWIGDDGVVDEVVRFHSVGDILAMRTAIEDVEIGGRMLRAGEGVIPLIGSANHDAAVFEDPDGFCPGRSARGHVGFGYGVHQCLGQNLVRAEMECVYRTLFARVPTLRVACPEEDLTYKYDGTVFGLRALPVAW
ncbi:cytochrome P450 [Streptomyces sp. NBC_01506]|uniref:cytochrome P450 n=1 Tax=Streptomyces sp. NBC_01506 TaxID=2903887 RepID=UPI00386CC086